MYWLLLLLFRKTDTPASPSLINALAKTKNVKAVSTCTCSTVTHTHTPFTVMHFSLPLSLSLSPLSPAQITCPKAASLSLYSLLYGDEAAVSQDLQSFESQRDHKETRRKVVIHDSQRKGTLITYRLPSLGAKNDKNNLKY